MSEQTLAPPVHIGAWSVETRRTDDGLDGLGDADINDLATYLGSVP